MSIYKKASASPDPLPRLRRNWGFEHTADLHALVVQILNSPLNVKRQQQRKLWRKPTVRDRYDEKSRTNHPVTREEWEEGCQEVRGLLVVVFG